MIGMNHRRHTEEIRSVLTDEQIDTLNGWLSKRHIDEVLDLQYLKDAGISDPQLRRLVKAYTSISDQLKRFLRNNGIRA